MKTSSMAASIMWKSLERSFYFHGIFAAFAHTFSFSLILCKILCKILFAHFSLLNVSVEGRLRKYGGCSRMILGNPGLVLLLTVSSTL